MISHEFTTEAIWTTKIYYSKDCRAPASLVMTVVESKETKHKTFVYLLQKPNYFNLDLINFSETLRFIFLPSFKALE